ncbi:GntR family transcriptional regulator [Ensifer sp. ENS11]|jgi:DNA-binding GntR family transcriptional regulator|uniref:GntR family transcriptional regulator n=1 Tax=Ensifer sp. ENS11 TaxID=2769291 RepID=UPI00042EDFA2|nr:GntR family transcriptional regulator [Ensifer sp. ENS11]AHK47433.1 putative AtrA transcriptional regulator [Ensifer adhaerens OV14]MBD9490415.1 GntR family transcriptional regulator [Ensifer sp. ENS11]MDP9632936.1 DNA-binding GntR family transcriptional regulator [Ensifer adhaerens]
MSQLPKINKGNLSEQVYSTIRSSLMDGRYEPGERLTIASLADQLGVSITPVREAIFRLVTERALEMRAATSIQVRSLTPSELREIQVIRHHLEGEAAAQAAVKISAKSLAALEALQADFTTAAASDPLEASRVNREFHFKLAEAAGMPMLYATIEGMWAQMGPLIHLYHLHTPPRVLVSGKHGHYDVLRALAARDADGARRAIQADIGVGVVMVDWLEAKGAAEAAP